MRRSTVVDEYLKEVKMELLGVDSGPIMEEIFCHIEEKAADITGGKAPDEEVYKKVITDLGTPEKVIKPYLREMPIRLPTSLKFFLTFQLLTGLASLIIFIKGMDILISAIDQVPNDIGFILAQITSNVFFLLIFLIMITLTFIQWKRPYKVASLGNVGAIVSISVIVIIIFVMFRIISWYMWRVEYEEDSYYPIAGIVMIAFIVIYFLGFQQMERFQRRIHLSEDHVSLLRGDRSRTRKFVGAISAVFVMLLVLVVVGQSMYSDEYYESHELLASEYVGGPYNATIQHWEHHDIDGKVRSEWFEPALRPSLDWLARNGEVGSTVLAWWDYGHAIRGYTGLDVIIDRPHRSMKHTIADPTIVSAWEDDMKRITDVAEALVTTDVNETIRVMKEYSAGYVFITQRDGRGIFYAILQAAGKNVLEYSNWGSEGFYQGPTELGRQTIVNRMLRGEKFEGLDLVYSDIDVRIYKIS